jgi:hypothetical protein
MLEGNSLSKVEEGEIEKINIEEEELKKLEKEEDNKFPCCLEEFFNHKCLFCWCVFSIPILLTIATVISITLMAIILISWGNKEEIYYPIQKKSLFRLLKNQEESNITNSGKTLQIISQNETCTSILMVCDNSVINKQGDVFSIEDPYKLNCDESRDFNYIDKV